jgi:uncharacterized protein (TIGR01777 family)
MRILVTGSSGLIGRALCRYFTSHEVVRLVRSKSRAAADTIYWNPITEEVQLDDFEAFDAVIHVAGDPIASRRWSSKKKESIFLSRARDTWLLAQILSRLHRPPKLFFSASGIGYYGDRGDEMLTEESSRGAGFLAHVCQKWEEAARSAEGRGVRVVVGRFGAVFSSQGGLLSQIKTPLRWGLGGKLGASKQWISWIALEDLVRAVEFTLNQPRLSGAFNFAAPSPIRHEELIHSLAVKLKRPAWLNLPEWFLKLTLGEMAKELLLASQRAAPKRLLASGFIFKYPTLQSYILNADSSF